jgi:hypothetical protein
MGSYSYAIEGSMAGQVIINSLAGFDGPVVSDESVDQAQNHADQVVEAWQVHVLPKLSNQYTFVGVTARGVRNRLISAESFGTVATGTGNGATLPTFVAAKVRLATATPGRAGRGRTGLCGLQEPQSPSGSPNMLDPVERADYETRMQAFMAALLAGANGIQLAVVSRVAGRVPRPDPLVSFVTAITVDAELGTRVSRLR